MGMSHILTAHESIHKQQAEIKQLIETFYQHRLLLQRLSLNARAVKNALPTLNQESQQNIGFIKNLQDKVNKKLESVQDFVVELNKALEEINSSDQKIFATQQKKLHLAKERDDVVRAWVRYRDILHNKGEVYFAKSASNQMNSLGLGLDIVEFESLPKVDFQAQSLEQKIAKKEDKINTLQNQSHLLHLKCLAIVNTTSHRIQPVKIAALRISQQIEDLSHVVDELYSLKIIAETDSIYGASVRGDLNEIQRRLVTEDPNAKDPNKHKPLYYACRAGHTKAALFLLDVTSLTEDEVREIAEHLPRTDKETYATLFAALQASLALYDHLWDETSSVGDNIIRLFKDYYSPEFLNSLPLITDQAKRVLSLGWDRKYIQIAEDIVTIFSKFEPRLKQDKLLCQAVINGKWNAFFENHPDSEDVLARRLHYVKTKLSHLLVNESEVTLDHDIQLPHLIKNPKSTNKFFAFFKSPLAFLKHDTQPTASHTVIVEQNMKPKSGMAGV